MKLITCSSYDKRAFKLFDTFRRYGNNDEIIWLIRDPKGCIDEKFTKKISNYYGNMTIDSKAVEAKYWQPGYCWYQPRWESFYMISDKIDDDETVVICDAFDVLIQKNFENYDNLPDDIIYCSDEGIKHKDNSWCMNLWGSKEYKDRYANEPVYNAGVLIMNGRTYKKITMLMMSDRANGIGVDQHLLQHLCYTHNIKLANTNYIIEMINPKIYTIHNGILTHEDNIPTIVHIPGMSGQMRLKQLYEDLYPMARCEIHEHNIETEKPYKPYLVGCYFSTKDRKQRLWTALLSILTQSVLPDYICIYNDGEPFDMTKDHDMSMILRLALRKGVTIEYKEGDKKHQTYNHNRATYEMPTDYIIRLDDDGFAENNLIEVLVDALNNDDNNLYSCATKWAHKLIPYDPTNKNMLDADTLEKNFLSTTEFDKEFTEPVQVEFMHGHCMAFKKDDKLHQPDWSMTIQVGEDVAFCIKAVQLGKKLFVIPTTTYWHLQPVKTASQDNTKPNEYIINIRSIDD